MGTVFLRSSVLTLGLLVMPLAGQAMETRSTSSSDNTAPVVSSVYMNPGQTTVIVSWRTNEPSRGSVSYQRYPIVAGESVQVRTSIGWSYRHQLELTGLRPGQWYTLRIGVRDEAGNVSQTQRYYFRTDSAAPSNPPAPPPDDGGGDDDEDLPSCG